MTVPDELWTVARCFGDILDDVVFVGGMIRELLITDPAAGPPRPTRDVDCIVNVGSYVDYAHLSDRLRRRGFAECTDDGAPLCRWVVEQVRVDVMPIDPAVLGFSNVWYPSAIDHAVRFEGPQGCVRIVDAPHFCATKIESFLARGEGDFYHHDMEDLIAVVDTRAELIDEMRAAPGDVRDFVARQIAQWLDDARFIESLPGQLAGDAASQARLPMLIGRLRKIASLAPVPVRIKTSARRAVPPVQDHQSLGHQPVDAAIGWSTRGTPTELPPRVQLASTALREAAYDAATSTLTITFQHGGIYTFQGVPRNVYAGLLQAASHGRYFNQWIKGRY